MPKQLLVDPQETRQSGALSLSPIPVHAYHTSLETEREARGDGALRQALRDMMVVREFETMLASFKGTGAYQGIDYLYKGPAHLSIGQEAAAVGAAMALKADDYILGSHRSHGEFIAKGLAAIAELDNAALSGILDTYEGGKLRDTVAKHVGGTDKTLGQNVLLFGLLAEIFMRENGFNGGMGGSMHAFFPPFGAYPNNAIVGASAGIATGAALRRNWPRMMASSLQMRAMDRPAAARSGRR